MRQDLEMAARMDTGNESGAACGSKTVVATTENKGGAGIVRESAHKGNKGVTPVHQNEHQLTRKVR